VLGRPSGPKKGKKVLAVRKIGIDDWKKKRRTQSKGKSGGGDVTPRDIEKNSK